MSHGNQDALSYFVGRTSPFLLFEYEFHSLDAVVSKFDGNRIFEKINPAVEVCLIGLVAHFEAFCKHLFAAAANINPSTLLRFAKLRPEFSLKLETLLAMREASHLNYGFLVADNFDFGSPDKLNRLFKDLVNITPLSKDEVTTYSAILKQRHLIVHHGGILNLEYCRSDESSNRIPYVDSIRLDLPQYSEDAFFLFDLALKMTRTVVAALRNLATDSEKLDVTRQEAISLLMTGVYDSLE